MGPLRLPLSGGGRLRAPTLRLNAALRAPRALRRSRKRGVGWLLAALLAAATVVGLIAWMTSPTTPAPTAAPIGLPPVPAVDASPLPSAPAPSAPSIDLPDPSLSSLDAPDPSLPDTGTESDGADSPETDPGPQTFERFVNLHVHEWSILWVWTLPWWPPAALLAVVGLAAWLRRLRSRRGLRPDFLASAVLAVLAVMASASAVTVPDSSGQPVRYRPVKTEVNDLSGGDRERVVTREARHRHLPVEVAMHWVFVAFAATSLSARGFAGWRPLGRRPDSTAATPIGGSGTS